MVESYDPDGMDLRFTTWPDKGTWQSSAKMRKVASETSCKGHTLMEKVLTPILEAYAEKLEAHPLDQQSAPVRPLSIYILTDGAWVDQDQPEVPIMAAIQALCDSGYPRAQLGIQFITFGRNEKAIEKMRMYDDMGEKAGLGRDIVDTEPSNGNVMKMLLGSVDDVYDRSVQPTSPITQ